MKVSDFLTFSEKIAASVSTLVTGLDEKFADAYSSLRNEVKDIRAALASSASVDSLDELRAAINLNSESLRSEIESRSTVAPTEIKAISCEGKALTIALSDGREDVFELPVIEGKDGVDGKDGKNGADGLPGENGKDGVDGVGLKYVETKDGLVTFISTAGDEYTVELPKPEAPALPADPRAPVDVKDAMIDMNGELTLVFSNGDTKNVGKIVGRDGLNGLDGRDGVDGAPGLTGERGPAGLDGIDGKDGKDGVDGLDGRNGVDGRDGFGFDDMSAELLEDGRTVNFKFVRGDDVKEFPMKFPVMIFRGGYQSDRVYSEGDVVAFGGSTFHANAEVIGEVPGVGSNWTQQTAAGLRGNRGERGIAGKDGKNGVNGKDLRTF